MKKNVSAVLGRRFSAAIPSASLAAASGGLRSFSSVASTSTTILANRECTTDGTRPTLNTEDQTCDLDDVIICSP